jgi:hypothetical protein
MVGTWHASRPKRMALTADHGKKGQSRPQVARFGFVQGLDCAIEHTNTMAPVELPGLYDTNLICRPWHPRPFNARPRLIALALALLPRPCLRNPQRQWSNIRGAL